MAEKFDNPEVKKVFDGYPAAAKARMLELRRLILRTAATMPEVTNVEETLKWGEPSYLTRHGSTLRIDWKEKHPHQVAMYFKCTSKLVPTFREIFGDELTYENNRAILFNVDEPLPEKVITTCTTATLSYHKVKQFPLLGLR
ncbi:MAG: DUF1801 domain-containing protein [Ekhidna sp.]